MKGIHTVSLFLFFYVTNSLFSQENFYLLKFDKKNTNFSANIISDIAIDQYSRVFIASPNGLYYYTGNSFNKLILPNKQRIISIVKNSENSILILFSDGSLYFLNKNLNTFHFAANNNRYKNPSYDINYSFLDGPLKFNEQIIENKNIEFNYFLTHSVYHSASKKYFIRDKNSLSYIWLNLNLETEKIESYNPSPDLRFYYHFDDILKFQNDSFYSPLQKYKFALPFYQEDKSHYYLVQKAHQPLILIKKNHLWKLNQKHQWELITSKLPLDVKITAAAYDQSLNQYYLGTLTDGLIILKPKLFRHLSSGENASSNNFYLQIPKNQNEIITNNGVIANNKNTLEYSNIIKFYTNNNSIKIDSLNYLLHSHENIYKYNLKEDHLREIKKTRNIGYTNYFKWSNDTTLIIQPDSIFLYAHKNHTFKFLSINNKTHLNVYRVIRIKDNLWFASCSGINIFHINSKSFIDNLFPGNCIRELTLTPKGVIASLYGTGLILINPKSYNTFKIPLDYRQSLMYAHSIYLSKTKDFLIPTNTGLLKIPEFVLYNSINKKSLTKQPLYLNEQDGLPTEEFNGGADPNYINFGDTLISYPTIKGLIQINPNNFITQHKIQDFRIVSAERSGENISLANNQIHLPTYTPEITLTLDFVYWGNSFNLPLYYRYNEKTYFVPIEKIKNLRILIQHYGYQELEFFTYENNKIKSLTKLSVFRNHLWYTQWYYILIGLMATYGLFFVYDSARNFRTEQKEEKLQSLINDKTKELNSLNEQLSQKVNQLTQSNNNNLFYISVINHDIFAPIKFINLIGNQLNIHGKIIKKSEILDYFNIIINSTKRLEILCSNILNHLNSERLNGNEYTEVNINELIIELQDFFAVGLKINQNTLEKKFISESIVNTNKDALNIILSNLISNANRFTQNGKIIVSHELDLQSQLHLISISDTGKGMTTEMMSNINSKNLEILNRDSVKYNSYGIGYNLIFKLLTIIHADLKVQNNIPTGTIVTLTIPVNPVPPK